MSVLPSDIRQAGKDILVIAWDDGSNSRYRVFDLRVACPCANCVDELTGIRRLDPATIPPSVVPVRITSVGNYALQIVWTDGHDTGIYSFDRLRELAKTS